MAKMTLDELVSQLAAIYGSELVGVALYGSAARGEHITKRSDINVIVVVERVSMEHLRKESPVSRAWRDAGNPPPLTLTRSEWMGSADIFPIEYADILAFHKVVKGTLPLEGIRVHAHELRLQLEHESMSYLLRLRHAVLDAGSDQKALLTLLEKSVSTMLVLLRASLRLLGEEPPADSQAVCARFTSRSTLDVAPVLRVLHHVRGTTLLSPRDGADLVEPYLSFANELVRYLDTFTEAKREDAE